MAHFQNPAYSTSMARLPRLVLPHQAHYISQYGHDRQPVFRDGEDYAAYLAWLREASRKFRVGVHAYVLLPEEINLLATPADEDGLGRMMQWVGRYYVPYFNRKYGRSGTLWSGRYKATVIDAPSYFLDCCRYMEMRPVLVSAAADPADYPWSSYGHHAGLRADQLISDHPLYWALGNTPFEREAAYRRLMEQGMSTAEIARLQSAVSAGWVLGPDKFRQEVEKQTRRRAGPARRGRPPSVAKR
jgi:putative transposase